MATTKTAKKKTGTKATSAKKKAAPKKATKRKVSTSTKAVGNRANFRAATKLAVDVIYEAGKDGAPRPTWGQALRAAHGNGSLALSGTRKRRKTAKKRA